MSGDHAHASAVSAGGRNKVRLLGALALTATYMVVEAVAGVIIGSLALLSDAGHMFTDVLGLGMAAAAIHAAERSRANPSQTYGAYRLEVLAALANSVLLFGVAGYVLYEAWQRASDPPDVVGLPLLIVATVGLAVNFVSFRLLRAGAKDSLNVRGAYLEVVSDALGSIGVIVAAVVVLTTGWPYADVIVGAGIGLFILPRTWRLGRSALQILLEQAPPEIDVEEVRARLVALAGVEEIHDLHIWTVTSGLRAASGHMRLEPGADLADALRRATAVLEDDFHIQHVTLQCEPPGYRETPQEV
jgi:cobalt-zinc-cadmium efflux system protein